MNGERLADRYEIVKQTDDRFVSKTIVKDHKAFEKIRTILSVNQHSLGNPNIVKWFNSQAELFTSISSDHVVDFIDRHAAGEIMESPTIVVEEPGMTLADLMEMGAIQPSAAQNIITKILLGVNELHERGYLHLDIRPEMIGVNKSATEVKLLSLGNCVEVDSDTMSLTPNTKYGAAECYSPTLKMERGTDIYSIGFLFYEMLSGTEAFSAQFASIINAKLELERNTAWTNWHVSDKELKPLDSIVIDLDSKLIECVHKMLDKNMDSRYSSASTVINELNSIVGYGVGAGLTGTFSSPDDKNKNKKSRWIKYTAGAVAGTLAVGLGAFAFLLIAQSGKNKVDVNELNSVVAIAQSQQKIIKTFGWQELDSVVSADKTFALGAEAYHADDLPGYLSHVKDSVEQYSAVIDINAPEAMQTASEQLNLLAGRAQSLGVENVPTKVDNSPEYADLAELENKYSSISLNIDEFSDAVRLNSRTTVIGSTPMQIEEAFATCGQLMESCDLSWYEDELERTESLTPFVLDKLEVTVSEFQLYADENAITTIATERNYSTKVVLSQSEFAVVKAPELNWTNAYTSDADNLPVVHVAQKDAADYCESIQKRLPTEAEWEHVASGNDRKKYPWGHDWDDSKLYWAKTGEADHVKPVGSFPPTHHGYYDLAGGVSEWTSSVDDSAENAFIKGASRFDTNVANMRVAVRRLESLDYSGEDVGFRCAKDLEEWPEYIESNE